MFYQLTSANSFIKSNMAYIKKLVDNGGPTQEEWKAMNKWIKRVVTARNEQVINEEELTTIRNAFGDAFSCKTLQGFSYVKPRGYAGDFEIIDRMYCNYLCDDAQLRRWDEFFQAHDSVKAVRNRKAYFKNWVLQKCLEHKNKRLTLLNVASGPGRDMMELLNEHPDLNLDIDCVEWDINAIHFANTLLPAGANVNFIHQNVFRFAAERSYDLIWSAGLFDYFDDAAFKLIASHFMNWVNPAGEIAIGNFQPDHGTYYYLQLVDWNLYHRTPEQLLMLAAACGIAPGCLSIKAEPLGANLFLHISNNKRL